jgi:hypothetical protein
MSKMPRVQAVLLPILRAALPDVQFSTYFPDVDYRQFPLINLRVWSKEGGGRHLKRPNELAFPVVEMTAFGSEGLVETELLYEDALEALYDAVLYQTQTPAGYLHSIRETMGSSSFESPFMDTWRIQGLIRFGVRPPRTKTIGVNNGTE